MSNQTFEDFYEKLVCAANGLCEEGKPPHGLGGKILPIASTSDLAKALNFPLPSKPSEITNEDRDALNKWRSFMQDDGERLAFYRSFHFSKQGWGIYYNQDAIRRITLDIMNFYWELRKTRIDPETAKESAFKILHLHESYHYEFDLYVTGLEIKYKVPLYLKYFREVYQKKKKSIELYEESLATRREVAKSPAAAKEFAKNFADKAPPGYKDYGRDIKSMRKELNDQIEQFANQKLRSLPPNPLNPRKIKEEFECPEYIVCCDINTGRNLHDYLYQENLKSVCPKSGSQAANQNDPCDPFIGKYTKQIKEL